MSLIVFFFFKKCEDVYYLFDRFGQMAQ